MRMQSVNNKTIKGTTMNVKTMLAQALNAQVAGDATAVADALKQVITAKAKAVVESNGRAQVAPNEHGVINWWEADIPFYGPFDLELSEGEVPGLTAGSYEMCVSADVKVFGRRTQGNFSSVAADPDEYFGEEPDYDVVVNAVQIFNSQDDVALLNVEGDAARNLVSEEIMDKIQAEWDAAQEKDNDDSSFDDGDRHSYYY